jgi:hypothetical protein
MSLIRAVAVDIRRAAREALPPYAPLAWQRGLLT